MLSVALIQVAQFSDFNVKQASVLEIISSGLKYLFVPQYMTGFVYCRKKQEEKGCLSDLAICFHSLIIMSSD